MIKLWNSLTEDAQDALLVVGFLVECYVLFGVMA